MGAITKSVIPASLLFSVFLLKATALSLLLLNITQTPVFPEEKQKKDFRKKNKNLCPSLIHLSFFVPVPASSCCIWSPVASCRDSVGCYDVASWRGGTQFCGFSQRKRSGKGGESKLPWDNTEGWSLPDLGWECSHMPATSSGLASGWPEMLRVSLAEAYWKGEKKEKRVI